MLDVSQEFEQINGNQVEAHFIAENGEENNLEVEEKSLLIRNTWSVNQTCALLAAIEARYDEMHNVCKRKQFWSGISEELSSQNIEFSEAACKKKWLNLLRTYKITKDIRSRTGRGPVKFIFYDKIAELLGDSGKASCSYKPPPKKTANSSMELLKMKKFRYPKFLQHKMEQNQEKEISRKLYIEESLKYKKQKLELYKEKIDIERLKVKALADLVKLLKEKNV